jgi:DMSO/TMAO reductase YedYZ molybdopterin-dependent catalytic subunit
MQRIHLKSGFTRLNTRFLHIGILIIVVTLLLSGITIFAAFYYNSTTIPQETPVNTLVGEQLYLTVGSKNIPRAAIGLFDKYDIRVELTQEESETVTSLENFFIMGSDIPEDIDSLAANPTYYELSIIGEVEHPITLSYEDILTKFEMKHMVTELYCMPRLTGDGKFSGPSLYDIILYAKPKTENVTLIFIAADGYEKGWGTRSDTNLFPLSKIKDHKDDFLLAVAMNGYPLAIEHGYPARLALASYSGASWVKWLTTIIVAPEDATREEYTTSLSNSSQNRIEINYDVQLSTIIEGKENYEICFHGIKMKN